MTNHFAFLTDYEIFHVSGGSPTMPPNPGDAHAADAVTAPASRRVLVVDDERLIADTVAQILNLHGYDAFTAYNGPEALKLVERFRPDFLLTDVMMPGMNGIDLALAVERVLPHIRVLLFSGQAGTNALLQRKQIDGAHFPIVAKPIHPERLVDALTKLKGRS